MGSTRRCPCWGFVGVEAPATDIQLRSCGGYPESLNREAEAELRGAPHSSLMSGATTS
jgi:hypothetical protein